MLDWALYTLAGQPLGGLRHNREGGSVGLALNGRRSAQVTIPTVDPMARHAMNALSTVLRVWWFKYELFAGVIHLPRYLQTEKKVQINAIDPGFQLERSHVGQRSDGGVLGYQQGVDQSEIMARLIDHARPTAGELAAGVPDIPIVRGDLPATVNRDRAYEPGTEIWQALTQLSEVRGGVDFELAPLPAQLPGERGGVPLCALNTFARQGADKTKTVQFTAGFLWEDCTVTWDPAGDQVINRSTWQGQSEEGQPPGRYRSTQPNSEHEYGIYGDYQGAADISETTTLAEHAQGQVAASAFPVDFFDIVPAVEGRGYEINPTTGQLTFVGDRRFGVPPSFGPASAIDAATGDQAFDYWIGDAIAARVRDDLLDGVFTGRVTDATITEQPETGDAVVKLTIGPDIALSGVT